MMTPTSSDNDDNQEQLSSVSLLSSAHQRIVGSQLLAQTIDTFSTSEPVEGDEVAVTVC